MFLLERMYRLYTLNSFNMNDWSCTVWWSKVRDFFPVETNRICTSSSSLKRTCGLRNRGKEQHRKKKISRFPETVIRKVGLHSKRAKIHCDLSTLSNYMLHPIRSTSFTHQTWEVNQVNIPCWQPSTVSGSSRSWCRTRRGRGKWGCSQSAPARCSRGSHASCHKFLSEFPSLFYRGCQEL